MKNADMPASPLTMAANRGGIYSVDEKFGAQGVGLSKRELFCLHSGVPNTGDDELDKIILEGRRQKFAAMAMQGILTGGRLSSSEHIRSLSYEYADVMLEALDVPAGVATRLDDLVGPAAT